MTKDEKKLQRDLFISLCFAGSDPDCAYLHNTDHTIENYEEALSTKEYEEFATEVQDRFFAGADLRLCGNLFRAEQALKELGPGHKNYPSIMKNYKELLMLTAPLVERLQKIRVESNAFENLELVIKTSKPDDEG